MSATQIQKEGGEAGWGCLESLGLSQKELVLAEALQMEYDALSRLKQDKNGTETNQAELCPPSQIRSNTLNSSVDQPRPGLHHPDLESQNLLTGRSASDFSLNQPGASQCPLPLPPRPAPPLVGHKESPYILDSLESGSSHGDSSGLGSGFLSKGLLTIPDEVPPAIPPRQPIPPPPAPENPFLVPQQSTEPRDINLFSPNVDQHQVTSAELNYDTINYSLVRLSDARPPPRAPRSNEDQSGKPVARSKTLPPQLPPRTYTSALKSNKNQRRVSAGPVGGGLSSSCLISLIAANLKGGFKGGRSGPAGPEGLFKWVYFFSPKETVDHYWSGPGQWLGQCWGQ